MIIEYGGWVTLVDFGIAALDAPDLDITALTRSGFAPCTPRYASPEQLTSNKVLTTATDLYSAGVVLYELVAGTTPRVHPSGRRDPFDEEKFGGDGIGPAADLGRGLRRIFRVLTAGDPTARGTAKEHVADLISLVDSSCKDAFVPVFESWGYLWQNSAHYRGTGMFPFQNENAFTLLLHSSPNGIEVCINWTVGVAGPASCAEAVIQQAVKECNEILGPEAGRFYVSGNVDDKRWLPTIKMSFELVIASELPTWSSDDKGPIADLFSKIMSPVRAMWAPDGPLGRVAVRLAREI